MKTYIVHYTKLKDRYENIESIIKALNCEYEFINEYDKEYLQDNKYYSPDESKFNEKVKDLWDSRIHRFRVLNDSEISCTIKHIIALDKISKQDDDIGLVLEDDAVPFEPDFRDKIHNLIKNAPANWDSIFLGEGCGQEFILQRINGKLTLNDNLVQMEHPATNCAEAYLIRKESAKRILDSIIPFQLVSDWELAYQFYKLNMKVYWAIPSLFYQGSKSGKYNSTLR